MIGTETATIDEAIANSLSRLRVDPEVEAVKDNPFWLLENNKLSIKTKAGELLPFVPNQVQRHILAKIKQLILEGKPIRIWVLKARQEGVSTLVEAIIYSLTSQRENVNSLILADDLDGSNYLFGMSKLYHEQLEDKFKFPLKRSNEKKIEFENRHSQVLVDTADNLDAGRKYTFQYVHLSEVAYFRDGKTLMNGLNQSVPELPNTMIIGETTANGVGGYFYNEWKKAVSGESDWVHIFLAWFDNPEYATEVANDFILTEEEAKIKEKFVLTDRQMQWRRNAIKNKCSGSVDIFNQEYPATANEAFLVSGRCRFNTQCLKDISITTIRKPKMIGNLVETHGGIAFQHDPKGILKIWEEPIHLHEVVVIGADVAEGTEDEAIDEKMKSDYSTAQVVGQSSLRQLAQIRCRYEEDVFAEELFRLGVWYGMPLLGVERNNSGIAVINHLKTVNKYKHLFHREVFAEDTQTRSKQIGWRTTGGVGGNRNLMLAELDRVIREKLCQIYSSELLGELMTFVRLADGKQKAQSGCHDDLVMAMAIALQMTQFTTIKTRTKNLPTTTIDDGVKL